MNTVTITLPQADAARFTHAVQDVAVLVNQAENVFTLLVLLIRDDDHVGHFGLHDMRHWRERPLPDSANFRTKTWQNCHHTCAQPLNKWRLQNDRNRVPNSP